MKWSIVYFDDQIENLEAFVEMLRPKFHVIGCHDPSQYSEIISSNRPHAYILDVKMPLIDGFALYDKIIEHPVYNGCPIFFISGDINHESKARSFKTEAQDFLSRYLSEEEILLRLSNRIKVFIQGSKILELGNLRLDMETFKATVNGKFVDLTLLDFRILGSILRSFPHKITRDELTEKIWGQVAVRSGTVNTHITNLRSKVSDWDYQIRVRDNIVHITKISTVTT